MIRTVYKVSYDVSLGELKNYLRIDPSDNTYDDEITLDFQAATEDFEKKMGINIAITDISINEIKWSGSSLKILEGNLIYIKGIYVNDVSVGYTLEDIQDNSFTVKLLTNVSNLKLSLSYRTGYPTGQCPKYLKKAIIRKTRDLFDIEFSSYADSNIKENPWLDQRVVNAFRKINF